MTQPIARSGDIADLSQVPNRTIVFDAERCVLSLSPVAECTACADACPHAAIIHLEDCLGLNEDACTQCGLCCPACPQEAIKTGVESVVREDGVLLACSVGAPEHSLTQTMACVHSTTLSQLADWHANGVRRLELAIGDCGNCIYGLDKQIDDTLAFFNRLAVSRGLPKLRVEDMSDAGNWRSVRPHASRQPDLARRRFLRAFLPSEEDARPAGAYVSKGDALQALLNRPSADDDAPLQRAVPAIDGSKCTGCDACVRLCPQSALILHKDDTGRSCYRVESSRCTGCGVCVSVCQNKAVAVTLRGYGSTSQVSLNQAICPACGVAFHIPEQSQSNAGLCWTCLQSSHHKKLFQVLE